MSGGHFKLVCACGRILGQCRCSSRNKELSTRPGPCRCEKPKAPVDGGEPGGESMTLDEVKGHIGSLSSKERALVRLGELLGKHDLVGQVPRAFVIGDALEGEEIIRTAGTALFRCRSEGGLVNVADVIERIIQERQAT